MKKSLIKPSKAGAFVFDSYQINQESKELIFRYKLIRGNQVLNFEEGLRFPKNLAWNKVPQQAIDPMLQALHLALGVSYWKLYCPTDIRLPSSSLSRAQASFWNKLYTDGMGEFYFNNKIDFRGLVNFPFSTKAPKSKSSLVKTENKSLLFFGGGKDSWTSYELLKLAKKKFTFFAVVAGKSELLKEMMPKGSIIVSRQVDPLLIQMGKQADVYKGHVPISMVWALIGEISAMLYGYRYVIASNEKSADYGNVQYLGLEVNHQWSKSLEAEKALQDYTRSFITPSITYFSLLRPLYELKIVEIFSQLGKKHFDYFTSCNRNFRMADKKAKSKWCRECPKCVFVFSILSPYLPKKVLLDIFGDNIFKQRKSLALFRELLGLEKFKPFECVGTKDEMICAIGEAAKHEDYKKDPLIKELAKNKLLKSFDRNKFKYLFEISEEHLIPKEFKNIFKIYDARKSGKI